jgi:large subunit ribosomal protein L4
MADKKKDEKKTAKPGATKVAAKPAAAKAATPARAAAKPAPKAERPAARAGSPRAEKKLAPKRAVARPVTRAAVRAEERNVRAERPAEAAPAPKPKREPRPLPTAPAGQAPVIGADGVMTGTVELPAVIASAKKRAGVLFQAIAAAAANARVGTAATKNRARVRGGGAKPWRQKGTGRARAGSTRSPLWRHGGVVFGPNARTYGQRLPEKMRRAAFAEAISSLAGEGRFLVYEGLSFDGERPRTKVVVEWLGKIGETGKALLVTGELDEAVARATANAPDIGIRTVGTLRTEDVLTYDTLLVRRDALEPLASRATVSRA